MFGVAGFRVLRRERRLRGGRDLEEKRKKGICGCSRSVASRHNEALYHALPMDYVTIAKLQGKLDGEANQNTVRKLIDKMVQDGYIKNSGSRRLGANGNVQDDDHEKLRRYKRDAVSMIHEYFLSDDIPELIRILKELGVPEYNPIFIKKLLTVAMDRKNSERKR